MEFILTNLVTILGVLGSGGFSLAYLFERRKNRAITKGIEADVDTKQIENDSKVVDLYKAALDDLPIRYEQKLKEVEQMYSRQIEVLKEQIKQSDEFHKKKIDLLKEEIKQLEASYERKTKLLEDEIKLQRKSILGLKRELKERDEKIKKLTTQVNADQSTK